MSCFDIMVNIVRKKSAEEGVAGVRTGRADCIKTFFDLGGFVKGVKVSRKSKRYCGLEKNVLLKRCVETKTKK